MSRSEYIGLRVTPEERELINERSQRAGLSLTQYMVACSLGTIDNEPDVAAHRFDEMERRLGRLEEQAFGF